VQKLTGYAIHSRWPGRTGLVDVGNVVSGGTETGIRPRAATATVLLQNNALVVIEKLSFTGKDYLSGQAHRSAGADALGHPQNRDSLAGCK
jgi:hypothetical protein